MLLDWVRRIGSREADKALDQFFNEDDLSRKIEDIIDERIAEFLCGSQHQNMQMTSPGWSMVLAAALRRYWPDLDKKTAARWMLEYAQDYDVEKSDWTPATAKMLAYEYASLFGEAA